jgi:hypothetical protein
LWNSIHINFGLNVQCPQGIRANKESQKEQPKSRQQNANTAQPLQEGNDFQR